MLCAIAGKYNRPHRKTNALLSGLIYCPYCASVCVLFPNLIAGQTEGHASNISVPATIPENVPSVQRTAYCLTSLWRSSYPTLPTRRANILKSCLTKKLRIFSDYRRTKKNFPPSKRKKNSLRRQFRIRSKISRMSISV